MNTFATRFHQTRISTRQDVNEVHAQRLLEQPLDYVYHVSFDDPSLEPVILAAMPDEEEYEAKRHLMKAPKDVSAELAPLYEVPLLNKEQEQHLFRKMNYLKHKASLLRRRLLKDDGGAVDPSQVCLADLCSIEELQEESNAIKGRLISATCGSWPTSPRSTPLPRTTSGSGCPTATCR